MFKSHRSAHREAAVSGTSTHSGDLRRLTAGVTSLGFGVLGWLGAHRLTDLVAGHSHVDGSGAVVHHSHGYALPMVAGALGLWLVGLFVVLRLFPSGSAPAAGTPRRSRGVPMAAISLPTAGFVLEEIARASAEGGGHVHGALYLALGVVLQALAGFLTWHLGRACLSYVWDLALRADAPIPSAVPRRTRTPLPVARLPLSVATRPQQGRAPPATAVL